MGKGNMFQGMARGKVGDVVFSRLNGEQISRVRNRHPRNPRTMKQLYQRAIMATILQNYSAGKEIYDHAFQGYAKGMDNQRRFQSINTKILRDLSATDNANGTSVARYVGPGSKYAVPFYGMQISDGSYAQNLMQITSGTADNLVKINLPAVADAVESAQDYINRVGIIPNDFYTIILYSVLGNEEPVFAVAGYDVPNAKQFKCNFGFIRLRVKDTISAIVGDASQIKWSDLFVLEKTNLPKTSWFDTATQATEVSFVDLVPDDYGAGALGIIRSRFDQDLRSTSFLYTAGLGDIFGLTTQYVIEGWQQGATALGDSELILEGGNF